MTDDYMNNLISGNSEYDTEYDEVLGAVFRDSANEIGDPNYEVFFECGSCEHKWSIKSVRLMGAAAKVDRDGCPLCGKKEMLRLTHHKSIEAVAPVNEFKLFELEQFRQLSHMDWSGFRPS